MNAYIFDVDGVLTDPQTKQVTVPKNLSIISSLLEKGNLVSFITGRALPWVQERVLPLLEQKLTNKTFLENIFISGEFGYTSLTFENRKEKITEKENSIPQELIYQVKILVEKYKNSMALDPDKKTMISIEMYDGYDLEKYGKEQDKILRELGNVLKAPEYESLDLSYNIITIDIKDKTATKKYAAYQFLDWLGNKKLEPEKYIAFGDNVSDMDIAKELHAHGLPVEFVYVGAEKNSIKQEPFPVVITKSNFESGTLEYLIGH